jgi:hypothetical protein
MAGKKLKLVAKQQIYCKSGPGIIELFPDPIVLENQSGVSLGSDTNAYIGQSAIDVAGNAAYICTNDAPATWLSLNTSASETPANLTVSNNVTFSAADKLNGVLVTDGAGAVTADNAALGYVLAGAGAATTPAFAQLTSSDHTLSIDSSVPGTIDFKIPGAGSHWEVVDADQTLEVNHGYIVDDVTAGVRVDLTLPSSAVVGSVIQVMLLGTTFGWRIIQGANQQIRQATTWESGKTSTVGAAGYVDCINPNISSQISRYASIEMVCVTADLEWNILSATGEINFQ